MKKVTVIDRMGNKVNMDNYEIFFIGKDYVVCKFKNYGFMQTFSKADCYTVIIEDWAVAEGGRSARNFIIPQIQQFVKRKNKKNKNKKSSQKCLTNESGYVIIKAQRERGSQRERRG
jgi:hypothetical protein